MPLNKNIKNLQILLAAMETDHLSKEDFVKQFEVVVNLIKKMQDKNMEEINGMWELCQKMKDSNGKEMQEMKDKMMSYCMSEMEKMCREHEKKMTDMDEKMESMHDGKDADEEKIVQDVLAQIKLPEYKETVLDTPEQLRDKLETLKENERLDVSAIKGLEEKIKILEETIASIPKGGRVLAGPNANAVQSYDISSQFDGSTKSFTVPRHRVALMVITTQAPIIYRPTTDFTTANTTLTFTANVVAPDSGQTGIFLFVK